MSIENGEIEYIRTNITKSDTVNTHVRIDVKRSGLGFIYPNRIWVAATATVVMVNTDGIVHQLEAMIPGRWHKIPANIMRINETGTTATAIHIATTQR